VNTNLHSYQPVIPERISSCPQLRCSNDNASL